MNEPTILLDVPLEDLKDVLIDKGYHVETVTKKLGSTKEDRADKNILNYAQKDKSIIVVTVDRPFVSRLRASGIEVIALELEDRAKIIYEKLEKRKS